MRGTATIRGDFEQLELAHHSRPIAEPLAIRRPDGPMAHAVGGDVREPSAAKVVHEHIVIGAFDFDRQPGGVW
jgi:hypothetical protein